MEKEDKRGIDMRKGRLLSIGILILLLIFPPYIHSKEGAGLSLTIEVVPSYIFWENRYLNEKLEDLGLHLIGNLKLNYRKQFGKLYFQTKLPLSYTRFNGPDGLTLTTPDHDIDAGFRSTMRREDLALITGYDILKILSLSAIVRCSHLKLSGNHRYSSLMFEYNESGILFGPGATGRIPTRKLIIYFDVSYLLGRVNTKYQPALSFSNTRHNKMDISVFLGEFGVSIPIKKSMKIGFAYRSEYYFRSPVSHNSDYSHRATDTLIQGVVISFRYLFN